jgi:hypothetical protein
MLFGIFISGTHPTHVWAVGILASIILGNQIELEKRFLLYYQRGTIR